MSTNYETYLYNLSVAQIGQEATDAMYRHQPYEHLIKPDNKKKKEIEDNIKEYGYFKAHGDN
jgi:hypothetical protein